MSLTPAELDILLLSLRVSAIAVIFSLPLAVAVAYVLARCRAPGLIWLDGLVHLPLILPPVVTGYLLLILLGREGVLGEFLDQSLGIVVAFRWTGAAIAAAVMGFPLFVRPIRQSIEAVDRGLEQAASTLGAGRVRVFATITLPLMLPGLITGSVLAFGKSLGEFGATITFVSNIPGQTQTLPLAIYSLTQTPNGDAAAFRLVGLSVILSMGVLVLSEVLARSARRRLTGSRS